jgi:5'(3')-deoxyribonucleotidase
MHPTLRQRIALDMDDVMADTLTVWLERYNQDFGTRITKADLHGKKLYDLAGPDRAVAARAYLDHPEFFLDLPLMEGSQTVVERLSETYEVFVTSAAMDHPNSFPAKYAWLKKHFPFIPDKNIVFCGDKSIIRADFMIDNSLPNLRAFTGQGIVFTAPHNTPDTGFPRVNGWSDVARCFGLD